MKKVFINLLSYSMGDTIASIPYASEYQKKHNCFVYFCINDFHITYLNNSYSNITLVGKNEIVEYDERIDIDFDFGQNIQLGYAKQLGFENPTYIRPVINFTPKPRTIKNKYIAMSIHSTMQLKFWNHPLGSEVQPLQPNWTELCSMLRKKNITPVVVEKFETFGIPPYYNGTPSKSNKKIGLPFDELMSIIYYSEFFIGLSSGLSWVAHAMGKKVALISNFTEDWNEFDLNDEDYIRISNKTVCHGCFNKIHTVHEFNPADWYWCPLHRDTPRQFECHTSITPKMVMDSIDIWL